MFECRCGQIARSLFEIERHPLGRDCGLDQNGDFDLVKADLEERPRETDEKSGNVTFYPKVNKDEVFK